MHAQAQKGDTIPDRGNAQISVRGTGRGKFIKEDPEKTAAAPQLRSSNAASIRSAKFYNSAPVPKADTNSADNPLAASPARASRPEGSMLAEALSDYYGKAGEVPPPMHTVDLETFEKIRNCGRLETSLKGTTPWSYSGIPRRGDFAIRLKRGADRFVDFVPSTITFGQTPLFYPRRVGVGDPETAIPVEHLEYFDVEARQWRSLVR
jgi:hypothetical protein